MSVPRPAMLVAIVTLPTVSPCVLDAAAGLDDRPRSCCLALSTSCSMPYLLRQHLREHLALLDAGRADQHRPAGVAERP